MPGSNTPDRRPARSRWRGCQTRTSSFHVIDCAENFAAGEPIAGPARRRGRDASARKRNSPTFCSLARSDERQHLADRNARRFFQEIRARTAVPGRSGRVRSAPAASCTAPPLHLGDRMQQCRQVAEAGVPFEGMVRAATAIARRRRPLEGRMCWSRAILPRPTMAILILPHEATDCAGREAACHLLSLAFRDEIQCLLDELAHRLAGRGGPAAMIASRTFCDRLRSQPHALVAVRHRC